jgi:hypothetical protein
MHCALDGVLRQIARPDPSDVFVPARPFTELAQGVGEFLWNKLRDLMHESLSLTAAIDELSETYLGGKDILFDDTRAELDAYTSDLRGSAELLRPLAT